MLLKVVESSILPDTQPTHRDIPIYEGEMFLLPPNTPHNPIRFAGTVGIVLEQPRPEGSLDTLRWYCQACGEVVHEASFHCIDLGTQIKTAVEAFSVNQNLRTCKACGTLADVTPSGVEQP